MKRRSWRKLIRRNGAKKKYASTKVSADYRTVRDGSFKSDDIELKVMLLMGGLVIIPIVILVFLR